MLAARIRSNSLLADAFARHEPRQLWTALEAQPSGRAFLAELRAFLDQYGHREAGGTLLVSQRAAAVVVDSGGPTANGYRWTGRAGW